MSEARKELPVRDAGWSPEHVERQLEVFHEGRKAKASQGRALVIGGGVLACAAAVWLVVGRASPVGVSSKDPKAQAQPSQPLRTDDRMVHFRDGSSAVLLTEDTELKVAQVTDETVTVELPEGAARFRVTPNVTRRFVVEARGLVATVLGTEFEVRHVGERTHVKVAQGRVQIDVGAERKVLTGGEAAWFEVRSAYNLPQREAPKADVDELLPKTNKAPQQGAWGAREKFVEFHRRAQYMKAYEVLSSDRAVAGSSPQDLMRAADAARYSGHPQEAAGYLSKVAGSGSGLAASAAFTLGRLYLHELGSPSQAADAFARTRALGGGGPLVEDALYREVEARAKAGQGSQARVLAQKYLKAYPKSRRAPNVARWGGLP